MAAKILGTTRPGPLKAACAALPAHINRCLAGARRAVVEEGNRCVEAGRPWLAG